jgi:hypothetical protein
MSGGGAYTEQRSDRTKTNQKRSKLGFLLTMWQTHLVRRPETSVYTIIVVSLELKLNQNHVRHLEGEDDETDFGNTDCVLRMQMKIASAMKKSIAAAVAKVAMIAHWAVHVQRTPEARETKAY